MLKDTVDNQMQLLQETEIVFSMLSHSSLPGDSQCRVSSILNVVLCPLEGSCT